MPKVIIIYGSSGGNTELVCQKVAETLQAARIEVSLKRVEVSSPADMGGDLTILAAPTYEHGVILHHWIPFLKALKSVDLSQQRITVIGLGEPQYDDHYHIESANTLTAAIKASKGTLFCHGLRVSGAIYPQLETRVKKWAEEIVKLLNGSIANSNSTIEQFNNCPLIT